MLHTLMNNDLLTRDLRKGNSDSMSFFMVGQPDVVLRKDGDMYQVEVRGFDYFSVAKGQVISGGTDKIAMWMLDTDYDGLVINPAQVFFPMDGDGAWRGVARALRAEVDAERMKAFKGCVSLPFKMRDAEDVRVAVFDSDGG